MEFLLIYLVLKLVFSILIQKFQVVKFDLCNPVRALFFPLNIIFVLK
jgi:hypothetical protein